MPYKDKPAFRCKNCGELEHAAHAAENEVPHACSVCGHGVIHHPKIQALSQELAAPECTAKRRQEIAGEMLALSRAGDGEKQLRSENWEVLADATDARLFELGLTRDQVEEHTPWPKGAPNPTPKVIAVNVAEGVTSPDKAAAR